MTTAKKSWNWKQKQQQDEAVPRLRKLLKLMDKGMIPAEIARLWDVTPQRIQQLRVKALRLRGKHE